MANIAKVGVAITASAGKFTSGLRSARKSMKGFSSNTRAESKRWSKDVGMSIAAVIAKYTILVLAVRRVMRTVLSEFSNVDEARKFAQSIGQAGELATNKLLAFEFAAKRVGASSAVARTGLRTMSKAIGEAQLGLGEGVQAMRILGLDARKLGTMLPTQAFLEISKAINGMENSTIKTAAAQKLFGRAGVRMLNLARLRGESIQELIDRHKELAGEMSEGDIAGIEAANDAMQDLVTAWKGLQRLMMAKAAPTLFASFSIAADMVAKVRKHMESISGILVLDVERSLSVAIQYVFGFGRHIITIGKNLVFIGSTIKTSLDNLKRMVGITSDWGNTLDNVGVLMYFLTEAIGSIPDISKTAANMFAANFENGILVIGISISTMISKLLKRIKSLTTFIAEAMRGAAKIWPSLEGQAEKFEAAINPNLDPLIARQEGIQASLKQSMKDNLQIVKDGFHKILDIGKSTILDAAKKFEDDKAAADELAAKWVNMFETIIKNADAKLSESPIGDDEKDDPKAKEGKLQFGAFAELGSQAAFDILNTPNANQEIEIQRNIHASIEFGNKVQQQSNDILQGMMRTITAYNYEVRTS